MSFIVGTAFAALFKTLGEKAGEKFLEKGIDKTLEAVSPKVGDLYKRLFGDTAFSDLIATEERRAGALATLHSLRARVNDIAKKADKAYGSRSPPVARDISPPEVLAALDDIIGLQEALGRALERAVSDYPSLVPLVGYLLVKSVDADELWQLVDPDHVQLNENFMFISTVPSYYRGRMGFMHTSRSTLMQELVKARSAMESANVPERTVVALRAVEKLSHELGSALFAAATLLEGKPKAEQLPIEIRVVGRFLRAQSAFHRALIAKKLPPVEVAEQLAEMSSEVWRVMGYRPPPQDYPKDMPQEIAQALAVLHNTSTGADEPVIGVHDGLAFIDESAKNMLKAVRRLGTVKPTPQ